MSRIAVYITTQDHGQPMTLEDFDQADIEPGKLYELGRGVIAVSNVPGPNHQAQVFALMMQLFVYAAAHPDVVRRIAGGADCKLLIPRRRSERHPDVAVYRTDPPPGPDLWSRWVPELLIEVVSPDSRHRDYDEKPEEYLDFGVQEYWIVDEAADKVTVHFRSGGDWHTRVLGPSETYTTHILPGFTFDVAPIFAAARAV